MVCFSCFRNFRIPSSHRFNRMVPYSTPRIAKLADWRLGILNILLQGSIICYLFWKLILGLGYVKVNTPTGIIKANVFVADSKYVLPMSLYSYCLPAQNVDAACISDSDENRIDLTKSTCPKGFCIVPSSTCPNCEKIPDGTTFPGFAPFTNSSLDAKIVTAQSCSSGKWLKRIPLSTEDDKKGDQQRFIRPCSYSDTLHLTYPSGEMNTIFITSRRTDEQYTKTNDPKVQNRTIWDKNDKKIKNELFVAGLEFATIRIGHNMMASTEKLFGTGSDPRERSHREMLGFLMDSNGNLIDPCDIYKKHGYECPSYISVGCRTEIYKGGSSSDPVKAPFHGKSRSCKNDDGKGETSCSCKLIDKESHDKGDKKDDILTIGTLLDMAGIDLDTASQSSDGESKRYSGIILSVTVDYSNTHIQGARIDFSLHTFRYILRVKKISAMEYKILQQYKTENQVKSVYNRHGIRIIFTVTGRIGAANSDAFIAAVVGALATASLVSVFINFIAFYVVKGWKYGGEAKVIEKISGKYTLKVEVIEATGVPEDGEPGSLCDPYIVLNCNFQRKVTRVIYETLNPKWQKEDRIFEFLYDTPGMPDQELVITLLDVETGKMLSNDTILANRTLNLAQLKNDKGQYLRCGGDLEDIYMDIWVELDIGGFHDAEKKRHKCKVNLRIAIDIIEDKKKTLGQLDSITPASASTPTTKSNEKDQNISIFFKKEEKENKV